jgi:hypothetical protein
MQKPGRQEKTKRRALSAGHFRSGNSEAMKPGGFPLLGFLASELDFAA